MNWRRSESISVMTFLCVIVGWIWLANTKVNRWDSCEAVVRDPIRGNDALDKRLTVTETNMTELMEDVKYIRRHMK